MESAAVRVLALLGLAAVAASAALGTVRVEKFGLWVERYSSGERHRSKGVDKCE
jgi:hypothetical protein